MSYVRILLLALLGGIAIAGLFVSLCILPKVQQAVMDSHTVLPPGWISITAQLNWNWLLYLLYVLPAVMVVAIILALLPIVPKAVRSAAHATLFAVAVITPMLSIYLLCAAGAGMIVVNGDLHMKQTIYTTVLQKFALQEEADGRFDKVQAWVKSASSLKMKIVDPKDIDTLSREQKQRVLRSLQLGLRESSDPHMLKQLLATTYCMRSMVTEESFESKAVLEAAAKCGAPSDSAKSFYDWLETQLGKDGWNPQPLPVFFSE